MRFLASAVLLIPLLAATPAASTSPSPEKWGPAPAIFPAGAEMSVMQNNHGSNNLFTVRLRFPNGYRIPPHASHEHVTVISGTFLVGMGNTMTKAGSTALHAGDFVTVPANQARYATAKVRTVVQVHVMGPFAVTYVNPADTAAAAKR